MTRAGRARASGRRERGAALLLLLVMVGLGMASVLMSAASNWRRDDGKERRTLLALSQAQDALIGFAILHGRLPRPARSAVDGIEAAGPCRDDRECTGFLPWVTLGVDASDGWGHLLRYSASPAFTNAPVVFTEAVATKTIRVRHGADLVYFAGNASCKLSAQCVPAVVLSTGKENFGVSVLGVAQANPSPFNPDERINATTSADFIRGPARSGGAAVDGGDFDDLLTWVPLLPLVNRINATSP